MTSSGTDNTEGTDL